MAFSQRGFGSFSSLFSLTRLLSEFGRYVVVGGFAFCVDLAVLVFCTEILGFHYLLSGLLAFSVGVTLVYVGSVLWVFQKRYLKDAKTEFAVFAAIGVFGLILNEAVLWLATDHLALHYSQSKILAAAVVFGSNFATRKYLLFREIT